MSDSLWPYRLHSPWNSPGQNTGVGSLPLMQGIFPTQGSKPGVPHCRWILSQLSHQGSPRILEWAAYPFFSGSSPLRNWTRVSTLQAHSLPTELSGSPRNKSGAKVRALHSDKFLQPPKMYYLVPEMWQFALLLISHFSLLPLRIIYMKTV